MQERLKDISITQSITIILVVLAHSFPFDHDMPGTPGFLNYLNDLFNPLRMPYFVFLSGFLFYLTNQDRNIEYLSFVKKKIIKLIVPYIAITTFAFFPKAFLSSLADRKETLSFHSYWDGIVYPDQNPIIIFWFLPTLFLILLLAPYLKVIIKKDKLSLNISLLLFITVIGFIFPKEILILNISGAILYLKYFFLGCLFFKYSSSINKYFLRKDVFIIFYFIVLAIFPLLHVLSRYSVTYLLFSIVAILLMSSIGRYGRIKNSKYLNSYAKYTYQVYLLHWFFCVPIRIFYKLALLSYFDAYILMFTAGTILPIFGAKIIDKYLPRMKPLIGM